MMLGIDYILYTPGEYLIAITYDLLKYLLFYQTFRLKPQMLPPPCIRGEIALNIHDIVNVTCVNSVPLRRTFC